ncbi:MAG: hypothetical protein IH810_06110 [Proteobacteria bacterium]|nr:hypothetical protein [Pseudomonadota bacterium]
MEAMDVLLKQSKLSREDVTRLKKAIYDERNKETHKKKRFEEYLQTKLNGDALTKSINLNMKLQAGNSNNVYGLKGVDFIAWSIFRNYEKNDSRFYELIKERISIERKWYV